MAPRIVVVGSGPVGAVVARRLAERGLGVIILEAGPVVNEPAGAHLRNDPRYADNGPAFLAAVTAHCQFYDSTVSDEGLPGANEARNYGGQSISWTNNCPELQAGFDRWNALDDSQWNRRYAEARHALQVTGDLGAQSVRGREISARLRAHFRPPSQRRVAPLPTAARRLEGRAIHWTSVADILSLPTEVRSRIEVRSGATVERIEWHKTKAASLKLAGGTTIPIDAAVLACGAFGTPLLLDASGIRPYALGRWLHFHPMYYGQLVLEQELCAASGELDQEPRLFVPPSPEAPWHAMILRDVYPVLSPEPVEENRLVEFQFFSPIEPRPEHRMELAEPRPPRFVVKPTAGDRARIAAMLADMETLAQLLGRWREGCGPRPIAAGFAHPMGTTRMGDDPGSSVVDRAGRVHGFDNLFVAGVGVVPVATAINTTLTAAALGLVTADTIADQLTA